MKPILSKVHPTIVVMQRTQHNWLHEQACSCNRVLNLDKSNIITQHYHLRAHCLTSSTLNLFEKRLLILKTHWKCIQKFEHDINWSIQSLLAVYRCMAKLTTFKSIIITPCCFAHSNRSTRWPLINIYVLSKSLKNTNRDSSWTFSCVVDGTP